MGSSGGGPVTPPSDGPWYGDQIGWLELSNGSVVPWIFRAGSLSAFNLADGTRIWDRVSSSATPVVLWTTLALVGNNILCYRETHPITVFNRNLPQLVAQYLGSDGQYHNSHPSLTVHDRFALTSTYELVLLDGATGLDLVAHALVGYGPPVTGSRSLGLTDPVITYYPNPNGNGPGYYYADPSTSTDIGTAQISANPEPNIDLNRVAVGNGLICIANGTNTMLEANTEQAFRVTAYSSATLDVVYSVSLPVPAATPGLSARGGRILLGLISSGLLAVSAGYYSTSGSDVPIYRFVVDSSGSVTSQETTSSRFSGLATGFEEVLFSQTNLIEIYSDSDGTSEFSKLGRSR